MPRNAASIAFGRIKKPYKHLLRSAIDAVTGETVILPSSQPENADEISFDPARHTDLRCPDEHCNARVHYEGPKPYSGGGNKSKFNIGSYSDRFATNPGQFHDPSCDIKTKRRSTSRTEHIDKLAGYRVFIHAFMKKFKGSLKYDWDQVDHLKKPDRAPFHYKTRPEDLKKMERVQISTEQDLAKFFLRTPTARLWRSAAIHFANEFEWRNFMIDNKDALKRLVSNLKSPRRHMQPVWIEVDTSHGLETNSAHIEGQTIEKVKFAGDKESSRVIVDLYIDSNDPALQEMFSEPGKFRILGFARLKTFAYVTGHEHHIRISITEADQVTPGTFAALKRKNTLRYKPANNSSENMLDLDS